VTVPRVYEVLRQMRWELRVVQPGGSATCALLARLYQAGAIGITPGTTAAFGLLPRDRDRGIEQ
jgi:hypothetical protein